jgi:hypothetical protein
MDNDDDDDDGDDNSCVPMDMQCAHEANFELSFSLFLSFREGGGDSYASQGEEETLNDMS